jgi:hypothetical protein
MTFDRVLRTAERIPGLPIEHPAFVTIIRPLRSIPCHDNIDGDTTHSFPLSLLFPNLDK